MNRLLLLSCCIIGCFLQCLAQTQLPSHTRLEELVAKEHPDTTEMRVLLNAGYAYVMRPGIERTDMDSATLYAEKVLTSAVKGGDKIWEGQASLLYSKILREQHIDARGKEYALKAKDIFTKHNKKAYLAETYIELADYYDIDIPEELNTRIRYYKDAVSIYEATGEKERLAHALYVLGDYYSIIPEFQLSKDAVERSVAIYNEIHMEPGPDIYSLLSKVDVRTGDFGNAMRNGLLAVKSVEKAKDTSGVYVTVYNRLALLYYALGDDREALKALKKAWPVAARLKDTIAMQALSANMAGSYNRLGLQDDALRVLKNIENNWPPADDYDKRSLCINMARCYTERKEYATALTYIQQLDNIKGGEDAVIDMYTSNMKATYYMGVKQYAKAHQLALDVIAAAAKMKNAPAELTGHLNLYRSDSAMGHYEEAFRHFREYKMLSDTLFNLSKTRQISVLQVQFETLQKDQEIKLKEQNIELLTHKAELQNAALNKARFTRNVIITGAAMLMILLLLGYSRYRIKTRSNREMSQKQDEINLKNQSLQKMISIQNKLLGEKEWLVKEIHHRVKNNLQIVMSLLNTQASFLDDNDALNAIRESRYRMQAISLIHQKLYQSENMALIDMDAYINDLVEYLKDGFVNISSVRFEMQVEPVRLDVSQSVPIGLILNEAITNAIKYAFTGNGIIRISLKQIIPGRLALVIADNGVGLPAGSDDPAQKRSMGMMLMNTLADQLEGTLNIQSRNGVVITIEFPYQERQTFTEMPASEEDMLAHA